MSRHTNIEWCDSTINLAAGCDGCELYNPANAARGVVDHCYAATITKRYAGSNPGFPALFHQPKLFTERMDQIARWGDLTGTDRPGKPWMNGLPRHIFHGDMGDYFTESLPDGWLLEHMDRLADMPHIHVLLTKRPRRMAAVFKRYGKVPENFKLGTSITSPATLNRVHHLLTGVGQMTNDLFLSVEPLLANVADLLDGALTSFDYMRFQIIVGGESGPGARPFDIMWARDIRNLCQRREIAFFMKQTGSNALMDGRRWPVAGKGHNLVDFPPDLRIRMMTWEKDWPQMIAALRGR